LLRENFEKVEINGRKKLFDMSLGDRRQADGRKEQKRRRGAERG